MPYSTFILAGEE